MDLGSMKSQKPSPPEWLNELLVWVSMIAPAVVRESRTGWCCTKHELEYSPTELELFDITVEWRPHHRPLEKWARSVYAQAQKTIKAFRTHEIVHFSASQDGFVLAIKPADIHPEDKGDLNIDL